LHYAAASIQQQQQHLKQHNVTMSLSAAATQSPSKDSMFIQVDDVDHARVGTRPSSLHPAASCSKGISIQINFPLTCIVPAAFDKQEFSSTSLS